MSKDLNLHTLELDACVAVADAVAAAREILPAIMKGEEKISISESVMLMGCAIMLIFDINATKILETLNDVQDSIDCAGAKPTEFWMQSDIAAKDKADELGINVLPEYSMADLRYKIYCATHEVL